MHLREGALEPGLPGAPARPAHGRRRGEATEGEGDINQWKLIPLWLYLIVVFSVTTSAPSTPTASAAAEKRTAWCIRSTPKIKRGIVGRRAATWRWQDALQVPRTRSSYRERQAIGCSYLRWLRSTWAVRADAAWRAYVEIRDDPAAAICHVFGGYCSEAIAVAKCESGHTMTPRAHNGQYLGTFQMGSSERELYGHGSTVLEQARAAYRYFVASGRDWSPWSCRWAAGR